MSLRVLPTLQSPSSLYVSFYNNILPESWNQRVRTRDLEPSSKPNNILLQRLHSVSATSTDSLESSLAIKEWEVEQFQEEIAVKEGIHIRRKQPRGPPLGYVGPFEVNVKGGSDPRNILEDIIWNKDIEVSQLKVLHPLSDLKRNLENVYPSKDFIGALTKASVRTGLPGLIAEVKKASPSRGILRDDFDPVEIAKAYEKGGAACLSVLTDGKYFQGSFDYLEAIQKAGVKCPLLCKEFIIDVWQLYYARNKGADAVLLIAAVLTNLDLTYLIKICKNLGLAPLIEVHDEREMVRVLGIDGVELIGINNRNLETFEVDLKNTIRLLKGEIGKEISRKGIIVVGESGLFTPSDIAYVHDVGVNAVLVGESIVSKNDIVQGITHLFGRDISIPHM